MSCRSQCYLHIKSKKQRGSARRRVKENVGRKITAAIMLLTQILDITTSELSREMAQIRNINITTIKNKQKNFVLANTVPILPTASAELKLTCKSKVKVILTTVASFFSLCHFHPMFVYCVLKLTCLNLKFKYKKNTPPHTVAIYPFSRSHYQHATSLQVKLQWLMSSPVTTPLL